VDFSQCLVDMGTIYRADPVKAVRGQAFIKLLHSYFISELDARLLPQARRRGIFVKAEATILGSHKPKDVDVAVIDPDNGPLMMIGVRSQMSSVGKNVLNYYEGIVGECISLQDRFPMSTIGYAYLMPLKPIKEGKEHEGVDHPRFAKLYGSITGRTGQDYKNIRGIYDQFAYLVVDFDQVPPEVRDDIVQASVPGTDLRASTFIDRMVDTFKSRMLFLDVFA
jgi:hypothetical protein